MDKINEYIQKIIKKANDQQAYHVFSVEHRSTFDKPFYMVVISWTKQGLTPLRIAEYTKAEVLAELKKYHRTMNEKMLNIRFHESQIEASKGVIKYHEDMIKSYKFPKKKEKK